MKIADSLCMFVQNNYNDHTGLGNIVNNFQVNPIRKSET